MLSKNISWLVLLGITSTVLSCEKTIRLAVEDVPSKVVVDGSIEDKQFPIVILSNSLNYFGEITHQELASSFIHGAVVDINNGEITHRLKEYQVKDDSTGYVAYYYSTDSSNLATAFTGEQNKSYSLSIEVSDGDKYTATTSIPLLAKICDSMWWLPAPAAVNNPSMVKVMGRFTDPKGYGNYIRVFTKTNSEPFYPEYNSAFDDQFTDGTTYDFQIDKSYRRNSRPDSVNTETAAYFRRGDTVTLKFCNIDKATFDFWRTWDYSEETNGNPFSSPVKVIGNISNNGLGAFCGYAIQYKTLVIPK